MIGILEQLKEINGVSLQANIFIGGVSSFVNTTTLLAARLRNYPSGTAFNAEDIYNFAIIGNNIEFSVNKDYELRQSFENTTITYFKDYDGYCKLLGLNSNFYNCLYFAEAYLPKCIRINGSNHFSQCPILSVVYIPKSTSIGSSVQNNNNFNNSLNKRIYAEPTMETINDGGVEGDLALAIINGSSVRYVTNYTVPDVITDLSVTTVYTTAIKLSWTAPASTNTIDYYEIYVDGILNTTTTDLFKTVVGLTNLATYNFTVIAVDNFYNKSLFSNTVTQQINGTTNWYDSVLLAYYRFNNDLIDQVSANNGTGTAITYTQGKSGNAASFNGSSSFISIPDNNDFSFTDGVNDKPFSIAMAVKFNSTGNGWLISKRNSSNIEWQVFKYSGKLSVQLYSSDNSAISKSTDIAFVPTVGVWYHFTFIYSGVGNPKIYINAVLQSTTNTNVGTYLRMSNTIAPIIIGKAGWFSGLFFNGAMDCLPIFNKELSQSEITNIFDKQNAGEELI